MCIRSCVCTALENRLFWRNRIASHYLGSQNADVSPLPSGLNSKEISFPHKTRSPDIGHPRVASFSDFTVAWRPDSGCAFCSGFLVKILPHPTPRPGLRGVQACVKHTASVWDQTGCAGGWRRAPDGWCAPGLCRAWGRAWGGVGSRSPLPEARGNSGFLLLHCVPETQTFAAKSSTVRQLSTQLYTVWLQPARAGRHARGPSCRTVSCRVPGRACVRARFS